MICLTASTVTAARSPTQPPPHCHRENIQMATSTIEWTDATWNPVAGCKMLSPGCTNCYAMRMAARLEKIGQEKYRHLTRQDGQRHVWTGTVRCDESSLEIPIRWHKPRLVFVNSMSDLFHADVPESFIGKVWNTMATARQHTFQILTKRPERMREVVERLKMLPNVWLGTSVESSEYCGDSGNFARHERRYGSCPSNLCSAP